MALVKGTNCGFVSSAPSADPGGLTIIIDGEAWALFDTTPSGSNAVTEIGIWSAVGYSDVANMYVAIYDVSGGSPNDPIGTGSGSTTGSSTGWNTISVNISIPSSTLCAITVGIEDVTQAMRTDYAVDAGEQLDGIATATGAIPNPWGTSDWSQGRLAAIYALYEAAGGIFVPAWAQNSNIILQPGVF